MIQICHENQIPRSTFYRWIQNYQQTVTDTGNIIIPQEFLYLKRKVKKLADIVQVLKKVSCTVSYYRKSSKLLEALYGQFSAHTLSEALDIPGGTFYNHIFRNKRGNTLATKRREAVKEQTQKIHDDSEQISAAGKIAAMLRNRGMKTSEKYVSKLMEELKISSISTTAKKEYKKWEKEQNRNLLQQFQTERRN